MVTVKEIENKVRILLSQANELEQLCNDLINDIPDPSGRNVVSSIIQMAKNYDITDVDSVMRCLNKFGCFENLEIGDEKENKDEALTPDITVESDYSLTGEDIWQIMAYIKAGYKCTHFQADETLHIRLEKYEDIKDFEFVHC